MHHAIELRHLRHFVALAEELHFGRAAKRCNISQPPFSVSIQQLEQALGFPLVERSSPVSITAAGEAFYHEAEKVLAQTTHAAEIATRVNNGMQGMLKVGFMASMLPRGLTGAVQLFEAEYPQVDLQLVELSTAEQIIALQRKQIQYGFVHTGALPDMMRSQPLLREKFVLCLPENHPHAGARKAVLADFSDEPFILFAREFSPTYYDQVISLCVEAGFHPHIRHEARHWLTVMLCVARGLGVTLIPFGLTKTRLQGLHFVDVGDSPIHSLVRGAWMDNNENDPILHLWRAVTARVWLDAPAEQETSGR